MTKLDRRSVMAGLAGLALPAAAEENTSPVAHGILANNEIALAFQKCPADLPDVKLVGLQGEFDFDSLKGRTILMPLWAEWCAPCLSELPDFARLQKKFGNAKFSIIPVLTGAQRQVTPPHMAEMFAILHAEALPTVMEKNFGARLIHTMGRDGNGWAIPCNLLIAPDGHVVGRETGRITADDAANGPAPEKTKDAESVTRAIHGQTQSIWGKQAGEEFARAMANGFLG